MKGIPKDTVRNNFSRNAGSYDDHSKVQRECAKTLLSGLKKRSFRHILEIGCGTGVYTRMLAERFPDADITAIDISEGMIDIARKRTRAENITFLIADAETSMPKGPFDLITSNASFQWFDHFRSAMRALSEIISGKGLLCFSIYGPRTFDEFKKVLTEHFGRNNWLSSSRFLSGDELAGILRSYFEDVAVKEELYKVDFDSFWDFLQEIKLSGTRGEGIGNNVFLGKYTLRELEETYLREFGGISATHQVLMCRAGKARKG